MTRLFAPLMTMLIVTLAVLVFASHMAYAATTVPPGNRNATQPEIPRDAVIRTRQTGDTFEGKFQTVLALFENDPRLVRKIKKTAQRYEIDPIHMVGAIVGEHTYNVDAVDQLQAYYVKALAYAETRIRFAYEGENVTKFVERPEFSACGDLKDSYALWTCREDVFNTTFRGQTVAGIRYPDQSFGKTFFQPLFAGQTFGLGQLNPLTALMMNDTARKYGRQRRLNPRDANAVYQTIMDPDKSLHYVAAVIRTAIDDYEQIAGLDISDNPGVTATLYNLGGSRDRARALAAANKSRRAKGQRAKLPQENYYGWLVNDRLETLRALLK